MLQLANRPKGRGFSPYRPADLKDKRNSSQGGPGVCLRPILFP